MKQVNAAVLAASALIGLSTNFPEPRGFLFNTRTPEGWRELDEARESKRSLRKARRAARKHP